MKALRSPATHFDFFQYQINQMYQYTFLCVHDVMAVVVVELSVFVLQVFYNQDTEVKQVDVPCINDVMGICPNHVPMLGVLKPGLVNVIHESGETKKFIISSGSVTINFDNTVQLLVEEGTYYHTLLYFVQISARIKIRCHRNRSRLFFSRLLSSRFCRQFY